MTMRDLSHNLGYANSVTVQSVTGSDITGAGVDLKGFNSATVVLVMGDIDEMGNSPLGAAKLEVQLQDSDDASAWDDVTGLDVVDLSGVASVTGGVVISTQTDVVPLGIGYVGERRYIRAILKPSGLTNGGPAGVSIIKGHPRHAPVG